MDLGMVVMWVVIGLMTGWLAGFVMKGRGYGLKGDLLLGLIGSIVGSGLLWTLGVSPDTGVFAAAVVVFLGALFLIVAQRAWYARASRA